MQEFALIQHYFSSLGTPTPEVVQGVGDDCALLRLAPHEYLAVSVDTSVAGVHFPLDADPWALGWRCLAIALSDLAAQAARPLGFTLALTLPEVEQTWLQEFSQGLASLAQQTNCSLLGGDTTRGPLNLSVQVLGAVAQPKQWLRSNAQADDVLLLIGALGWSALGLKLMQNNPARMHQRVDWNAAEQAYMLPQPLIAEALSLHKQVKVNAAIDISDGLLADLNHLLLASKVGAQLDLTQIEVPSQLSSSLGAAAALEVCLTGGEDYALLLSLPASELAAAIETCPSARVIGRCFTGSGIIDQQGRLLQAQGFQHF